MKDRQLQDQVRRLENAQRRTLVDPPLQHWYESYYPSVEPIAANFRTLHTADNEVILMPLHLHKAMDVRSLSIWGRDSAGTLVSFAFALYRAMLPRETLTKLQQATAPVVGGGGSTGMAARRYNFELGGVFNRFRGAGAIALQHVLSAGDLSIDPERDHWFLGIMVFAAATNQLFAPAMTTGGPHCAYRATERGVLFGDFPQRTAITSDRVTPPHFVLRSALGARLYADPTNG